MNVIAIIVFVFGAIISALYLVSLPGLSDKERGSARVPTEAVSYYEYSQTDFKMIQY